MPIRGIVAVILLLLVLYGGFKAAPLLLGPRIDLTSPLADEVFPDGRVLVAGIARNTENLTLDGAPLLIDRNGFFSTTLNRASRHDVTARRLVFLCQSIQV